MRKLSLFLIILFMYWGVGGVELNLPFVPVSVDLTGHVSEGYIDDAEVIIEDCKSLDYLPGSGVVISAREMYDGYYDLIVFKVTGRDETLLTHNRRGAPLRHMGNPSWHPKGKFIVFTAMNNDAKGYFNQKFGIPGTGMNNNIWITDRDGDNYWQLTFYQTILRDTKAVIHPRFSPDGDKLIWAERLGGDKYTKWGEWVIKTADFRIKDGIPGISGTQTIRPVKKKCFYEAHDFSSDGSKILFSGNLEDGQEEYGLDIYEYNLETEELKNLTNSPDVWDEHAHYSPDGRRILWMSSRDLDIKWKNIKGHRWQKDLKTELWIMDIDGKNPARLTYFNDIPNRKNVPSNFRVIVSDNCWLDDGNQVIATTVMIKGGQVINQVMKFTFK